MDMTERPTTLQWSQVSVHTTSDYLRVETRYTHVCPLGDMVLYESHSVLHGRPFPLKGRYMANLFVHFEPIGHSLRHFEEHQADGTDVHDKYREAVERGQGGHENDNTGLPPYIIPGTPEDNHWRMQHPGGFIPKESSFTTGSSAAHVAAQVGSVDLLKAEIEKNKEIVKARDKNGWTALHEGARAGHLDVVKYLIENGADVNATTKGGESALWWAKQIHDEDHPVIEFLESLGAVEAGPEL